MYAYYVLRTISYIISQGSIFCIAVAYVVRCISFIYLLNMFKKFERIKCYFVTFLQADIVDNRKRVAVFSWITGLFSASHVVGNLLARFLPEEYIFEVRL